MRQKWMERCKNLAKITCKNLPWSTKNLFKDLVRQISPNLAKITWKNLPWSSKNLFKNLTRWILAKRSCQYHVTSCKIFQVHVRYLLERWQCRLTIKSPGNEQPTAESIVWSLPDRHAFVLLTRLITNRYNLFGCAVFTFLEATGDATLGGDTTVIPVEDEGFVLEPIEGQKNEKQSKSASWFSITLGDVSSCSYAPCSPFLPLQ